jgi:hypothetical protein
VEGSRGAPVGVRPPRDPPFRTTSDRPARAATGEGTHREVIRVLEGDREPQARNNIPRPTIPFGRDPTGIMPPAWLRRCGVINGVFSHHLWPPLPGPESLEMSLSSLYPGRLLPWRVRHPAGRKAPRTGHAVRVGHGGVVGDHGRAAGCEPHPCPVDGDRASAVRQVVNQSLEHTCATAGRSVDHDRDPVRHLRSVNATQRITRKPSHSNGTRGATPMWQPEPHG